MALISTVQVLTHHSRTPCELMLLVEADAVALRVRFGDTNVNVYCDDMPELVAQLAAQVAALGTTEENGHEHQADQARENMADQKANQT